MCRMLYYRHAFDRAISETESLFGDSVESRHRSSITA